MQTTVTDLLEAIRQPKYTGENRCRPCIVVNTLIAVAMSGFLSVLATPIVGGLAFLVCVIAIYLRGYLVPGTPTLTKRYLPDRVRRLFGTHLEDAETTSDGGIGDAEPLLRATGVVVDCPDEDDLCLEATFRTAWHERLATLEDDETRLEALASRLDLEAGKLALEGSTGGYVARYGGDRIGIWPSEAAFLADLAAAPALDGHAGWQDLTADEQGAVLAGLRVFLEACPTCGGEIDGNEETVESCCSTATRMALECGDCGARLLRGTA